MAFRQDETTKLENKLFPDALKSDSTKAGEHFAGAADTAASYIPGQHQPTDHFSEHKRDHPITHDTGRASLGDQIKHAVQPHQSETLGDTAGRHADNVASGVVPGESKGLGQKIGDTVNPEKHEHVAGHPVGHQTFVEKVKDKVDHVLHPDHHKTT